jgi:zinc D-Ala-D-Ala carboxypeptidase
MDVFKLDKLLIRDCIIILAVILTGFTDMFLDTKSKPESTPSFQSKSESTPSVHAKQDDGTIHFEANLESISVLVNNLHKLPESYSPPDLICADIPFVFQEKTEKRKMRAEAAGAIKDLFIDAKAQGISLLGVSAKLQLNNIKGSSGFLTYIGQRALGLLLLSSAINFLRFYIN